MTCRAVRLAAVALLAAGSTGCVIVERPELDASGFPVSRTGALEPPSLLLPVPAGDAPPPSPSGR
jgi:hypothetical protein